MSLIGPKPESPQYPTPWVRQSHEIFDANDELIAEVHCGPENYDGLTTAIVDAVNAYYGADPMGAMGELERTEKDTRIVVLEGRAQVAEELVKKLQKEAGARNERWAIMVREVDKRNDRIAELENRYTELSDAYDEAAKDAAYVHELTERAEASEEYVRQLSPALEKANKRAEKAEARVEELERLVKRYRKREAFDELRELTDDDPAAFTAPDGRVFHVGQRVKVRYPNGHQSVGMAVVDGPNSHRNTWLTLGVESDPEDVWGQPMVNLRRVWDGTEEPDVPVGTMLRDADDCLLRRKSDGWSLYHPGTRRDSPPDDWETWDHSESLRPYVEVLDGDE